MSIHGPASSLVPKLSHLQRQVLTNVLHLPDAGDLVARSRQGNKGTVEERIVRIGFGAFFIVIIYGIIYPQTLFLGRCHAVGAPTART